MKIRVRFDNNKSGNDSRPISRKNRQGGAMFYEFDMDTLYALYQMLPFITTRPGKKSKFPDLNKQIYEDAAGIPRLLPASGHDTYNYVARYGAANFQIQAVMKLDGRLDHDLLEEAVRLSVDTEPIFGCRFVENETPYWRRLDDIDNTQFCSFEKTGNLDEAIQKFLDSPFSMDNDPMIKLRLISCGPHDALCFKINHTCCDGTGAKEYFQLLSDIYTRIDQDDVYVPKPRVRNRYDQDRLFDALGIKDPESAWDNSIEIPELLWTFPWLQGKPDTARVAVCKLPGGYIEAMSRYAKTKGANINDILFTVFYRAMFNISQPPCGIPMHIGMTVDLRRYLPDQKTSAIRNFSGGVDTSLTRIAYEPFDRTLSRVSFMLDEIRKGHPGLQSAVGLERVEKANFYDTRSVYRPSEKSLTYTDEFAPVLSNLGFISKSPLRFGKTTVTEAFFVPPAISAPGLLLCISSYNNKMTFSLSYYETQARRESIDMLMNQIRREIITGCI